MLNPATHMYMYEIKDGMKLYWLKVSFIKKGSENNN